MDEDAPLYPVALAVAGRPCLVVGGGAVAGRKIGELLGCRAAVTVVAPEVHRAVAVLVASGRLAAHDAPPVDVQLRPYRHGEAARYRLVVTATGVAAVDAEVVADAEAAGVWVNCADDRARSTALLPAVHRDGPVSVAVSTGGASPAMAVWLRGRVAAAVGPGLGALAELLAEGRRRARAAGAAVDWGALLDGPLPDLVRQGRMEEARALVEAAAQRPLPS